MDLIKPSQAISSVPSSLLRSRTDTGGAGECLRDPSSWSLALWSSHLLRSVVKSSRVSHTRRMPTSEPADLLQVGSSWALELPL